MDLQDIKFLNMKKTITLNKEHLKLIPFFFIQEIDDDTVGVTSQQLFNVGSHLLEDIAMILGLDNLALPNTKNDADGRAFPDDVEKHMLELYTYIKNHLFEIETLIHQFACDGGLTEGVYKALDNEMIWEKVS